MSQAENGMPREWMRGPQFAPASRKEWEPIIAAARQTWNELETLSVAEGVRPGALLQLSPDELVQATAESVRQGFTIVPLTFDGRQYRAVLARTDTDYLYGGPQDWVEAWSGCDDERIGELLGFPECCRKHFVQTWARGTSDTVTTIASSTCIDGPEGQREELNVDGPPEANLLLRHLGVRLVPHLPCSPTCEETVDLARETVAAGIAAGIDPTPLYRVLDLPVTYNALHGVAVIETPHFRLWAGTDYTPLDVKVTRAATETRAAVVPAGVHIPGAPGSTPGPATTWEDNGFASREAMDEAHATVLEAVGRVNSAIDLGCGDGVLLEKIADGREGRWIGVEHDHSRVERGRQRHQAVGLHEDDIAKWVAERQALKPDFDMKKFDVALLMPGRLLEMSSGDADRVRGALPELARRLVIYAYGDVLKKYGDLRNLAADAGLVLTGDVVRGPGVEAAEAEVNRPQGAHICCRLTKDECEAGEPHHHDGAPEVR